MRKTDTIDIGKGIQYAKVASRLAAFHEDNGTCQVTTVCEFKEGHVLFSATVTTKKGTFTGHSLGKATTSQKAFEKLETISVGRALAFAGYLASGAIASQEEMDDVEEHEGITLSVFNDLKRAWLIAQGDMGKPKNQLAVEFATWAAATAGVDVREAGDWKAWTQEQVDRCIESLAVRET